MKVVRLDGTLRTAEVTATLITDAEGSAAQVILHDVTERKEREGELKSLNRTLKALSNINQSMVRASDEAGYMEEVCRIVVEDCGHAMVWIGLAEDDEAEKRETRRQRRIRGRLPGHVKASPGRIRSAAGVPPERPSGQARPELARTC